MSSCLYYCPPTKLWGGSVFTSVCHSVQGDAWSHVPSRVGEYYGPQVPSGGGVGGYTRGGGYLYPPGMGPGIPNHPSPALATTTHTVGKRAIQCIFLGLIYFDLGEETAKGCELCWTTINSGGSKGGIIGSHNHFGSWRPPQENPGSATE